MDASEISTKDLKIQVFERYQAGWSEWRARIEFLEGVSVEEFEEFCKSIGLDCEVKG